MAYCNRCGAYIPDGQSKCLACGFDPGQESGGSKAGASQREQSWAAQELEREKREQDRRRRQEEYRQNAQEEHERRQAQAEERRQRQEEYRQSAQREYERRQTQRTGESRAATGGGELSDLGARLLAMVSYFNFLWILPYLICPGNPFVRFHARQGFALFLFEIVAGVVTGFFGLGWVLNLFSVFCVIKGIIAALSGRTEPLPLVGKLADRMR